MSTLAVYSIIVCCFIMLFSIISMINSHDPGYHVVLALLSAVMVVLDVLLSNWGFVILWGAVTLGHSYIYYLRTKNEH